MLELNHYTNQSGQRFAFPEHSTEPPEDVPLRYCARCRCEIYHGEDELCGECREEAASRRWMLDCMKADPGALLDFLENNIERRCLDRFFQAFGQQCGEAERLRTDALSCGPGEG